MNPNPDPWRPLGAALLDYHRGARSATFTVCSDLWEDEVTPVADYYRPREQPLPELEQRALAACRGKVLDLGAGAGRHALELQDRGLEVTAVDISAAAVAVMAERGVRNVRRCDLFAIAGRYDSVLLLMHGIGVVGTIAGLARFLEWVPQLLREGGQILCDSADLRTSICEEALRVGRCQAAGTYVGEVRFHLTYGELDGPRYPWLFVDPLTLERTATAAGLRTEIVTRGEQGHFLARLY